MADDGGDVGLHLPSLRIEGFRGIDKLTIPRLASQDEADACSASGNRAVLPPHRQPPAANCRLAGPTVRPSISLSNALSRL